MLAYDEQREVEMIFLGETRHQLATIIEHVDMELCKLLIEKIFIKIIKNIQVI